MAQARGDEKENSLHVIIFRCRFALSIQSNISYYLTTNRDACAIFRLL